MNGNRSTRNKIGADRGDSALEAGCRGLKSSDAVGPETPFASRKSPFVGRCNAVRKRIPFAYWIVYDVVALPLMAWGAIALSAWFCLGLAMLAFAAFFDVTEAIVKWDDRG